MMSAESYQNMKKEKAFSYIDNRSNGIRKFLYYRSQSLTLEKMIEEVQKSIPILQEKEAP